MKRDIRIKTTAFLIDSLSTCLIRCWFAQENIMNTSLSKQQRLDAAIRAQELNATRSELIRAIDVNLGEGDITMGGIKTYSYFDSHKNKKLRHKAYSVSQVLHKRKKVAMKDRWGKGCGGGKGGKKGKKGGKKKKS